MVDPCIQRGFSRADLIRLFVERGYTSGAEIGVRQGAFALALCRAMPDLRLLCVDPWTYYQTRPRLASQDRQDRNYAIAVKRLAPYQATLVRQFSAEAVRPVPLASLDFVYIDGNHAYLWIRQDLDDWSPRVRVGGIVSGDDYDAPGVYQAVHEFVEAQGIREWSVIDDQARRNRKGQRFRSWWWVQER